MKVLVTGASGFVGQQLVPQLLAAGHEVRALVRNTELQSNCEKIRGALPDPALSKKLCTGVDAVIHAAGVAHVNSNADTLRAHNLDATVELAAAAKACGVRKFIFVSSCKAHYPLHSAYARFKAEAEAALRTIHDPGVFDVIVLRPALVYGRGMKGNLRGLLRVLSKRQLPVFLSSTNPFGLISVNDLCRALLSALTAETLPNQVWELSDGVEYSLDYLVREVRNFLGLRQPAVALPRPVFRGLTLLAQAASPFIKSGLSTGTYRTLFEEAYTPNREFSHHTGFTVQDAFLARLPELLEDIAA